MSVCDGATIRRERILDMLAYCNRFMPMGTTIAQVFLYMAMNHGLKDVTVQKYLNEMQLGGIVTIQNGRILMKLANFKRMIEIVAPTRDPMTGEKLIGDIGLAVNGIGELEDEEEGIAKKPEKPKRKRVKTGQNKKADEPKEGST